MNHHSHHAANTHEAKAKPVSHHVKNHSQNLDEDIFGTKKNTHQNKRSILTKILFLFISISVAAALYVGLQNYRIKEVKTELKTAISAKQIVIDDLEKRGKIVEKQKSQEVFSKLESERIKWSGIVKTILEDLEREGYISIGSIKGSEKMKFGISGEAKDFETVAKLIKLINLHEKLENPFVSTVQTSNEGKTTFSITFDYKK